MAETQKVFFFPNRALLGVVVSGDERSWVDVLHVLDITIQFLRPAVFS